jgi:acyl-CoA thioesterase-2
MTDPIPSPDVLARNLVDLLDIEEIDTDLYRGPRTPGGTGRVFGGQVIAQALQAAQRSTDAPKTAHSLHAYFMRPGDDDFPIIFRVVRDFDGRSFATRRVIATQQGKPIFNMAASFQRPETGLEHQDAMPDVPGPEDLKNATELRADLPEPTSERLRFLARGGRPIEIRPTRPETWFRPVPQGPVQNAWFRVVAPIGDDPAMHRAVLAYASDMGLLGTAAAVHGINGIDQNVQTASLDHALWFHGDFRADEWLLFAMDSPWAGGGRGLGRGNVYTRDGRLVASAAQEGLIRVRG